MYLYIFGALGTFSHLVLIYPPLMQKITIVGNDSAAKTALIIALSSPTLEIIDLRPGQIQTHISSVKASKLAIYVDEEPDRQIIDRLHGSVRSLVLIARYNSTPNINDLFIPITAFQNFAAKGILKEIRAINKFFDHFQSGTPKLNDIQRKVFLQLGDVVDLSDENNWNSLHLSRSKYFNILEQLRMLVDVEKNWQLIHLAKDPSQLS
jgi:hypothetical protein